MTSDDLAAVLGAADPGRPALAQLLAMTSVGTSTAYRYLDRARRQGLVEVRSGRLYPARPGPALSADRPAVVLDSI